MQVPLHQPLLQTGGFSQACSSSGFGEELSELFSFKQYLKFQLCCLFVIGLGRWRVPEGHSGLWLQSLSSGSLDGEQEKCYCH